MSERRGFWLGIGAVLAGFVGWLLLQVGIRRAPPPPPPPPGGDVLIVAGGGD
jgi:hypothetical protein